MRAAQYCPVLPFLPNFADLSCRHYSDAVGLFVDQPACFLRPGRRNVVRVGAADHGAWPSSLRFRVLLHARVGQVRAPAALAGRKWINVG